MQPPPTPTTPTRRSRARAYSSDGERPPTKRRSPSVATSVAPETPRRSNRNVGRRVDYLSLSQIGKESLDNLSEPSINSSGFNVHIPSTPDSQDDLFNVSQPGVNFDDDEDQTSRPIRPIRFRNLAQSPIEESSDGEALTSDSNELSTSEDDEITTVNEPAPLHARGYQSGQFVFALETHIPKRMRGSRLNKVNALHKVQVVIQNAAANYLHSSLDLNLPHWQPWQPQSFQPQFDPSGFMSAAPFLTVAQAPYPSYPFSRSDAGPSLHPQLRLHRPDASHAGPSDATLQPPLRRFDAPQAGLSGAAPQPPLHRSDTSQAGSSQAPLPRSQALLPLSRPDASHAGLSGAAPQPPLHRSDTPQAGPSQAPLPRPDPSQAGPSQTPLPRSDTSQAGPSQAPLPSPDAPQAGPSQAPLPRPDASHAGPSGTAPQSPLPRSDTPQAGDGSSRQTPIIPYPIRAEDIGALLGALYDKVTNLQQNVSIMEKGVADERNVWSQTVQTLNSGMGDIQRNTAGMADALQPIRRRKGKGVQRAVVDHDPATEADDEGRARKMRRDSQNWLKLQSCVRHHLLKLLSIESLDYLSKLPPPLTRAEIKAFEERDPGVGGCTVENFRIDLKQRWSQPFNQTARYIFIKSFVRFLEGGLLEDPPSIDFVTQDLVGAALDSHIMHVVRLYRKLDKPLSVDDRMELLRKNARDSRKDTLLKSRHRACKSRQSITHHRQLLKKLDRQAMSGDESDHDHPGPPKTFLIIRPTWQSRDLADFLHKLDDVDHANWRNHHGTRGKRGNPPRIRAYHPSKSLAEQGHAPVGLPRNCYDAAWLRSLPEWKRAKLEITDEVYKLHVDAAELED